MINRRFRLAARPVGAPKPSDWTYEEVPVEPPGPGQLLVGVEYVSLDPAMRGWMNAGKSYVPPVELGEVMRAGGCGRVLASNHPKFAVGDAVVGLFGVQSHAVSDGKGVERVDAVAPITLGTLGMTGYTAYFGLLDVGKPVAGDTVVVSGAAGAVGMIVGQLAKLHGCRAVGIAGGPDKCKFLTETLGFDAAVDYRDPGFAEALRAATPTGVNVYFDNVGGDVLDAVLARLARGARVVICGAISQYNAETRPKGPSNYLSLLVNRATMQGMVVFDYAPRYAEARAALAGWLAEGKLVDRQQVVEGLETFPDRLAMLFRGENTGKLVLKV
ncbi:MAG: NADP-dependent oxidoreductase [Myxococcota bacterium]